MRRAPLYLSSVCFLVTLSACTVTEPLRTEPYEQGTLVLEEGQFQKSNASVSFIKPTGVVLPNIFTAVNDRSLGDVLQSYTEIDGKGYLVVNNSDKVEVVESSTFRAIATIDKGVEQARYLVAAPPQDGRQLKAYVSCWGGKSTTPSVAIVSLADRRVIGQIPVGAGPEQLLVVGNQLFVANSGGIDVDKTISVINTTTDQVVATIPVGDVPTSLVYDPAGGLIHVLCSGKPTYTNATGTTTAELVRIDPATRKVTSRLTLGGRPINGNPTNLTYHAASRKLFFLFKGAIYTTTPDAPSVALDRPLVNRTFYGLGIQPATGIIYGADARDFNSRGVVRRYQPSGTLIDTAVVGLIPNGFYFR